MIRVGLFLRLTYTFSDGWAGHDAHVFLCDVKMTPPRVTHHGSWDEGTTYVQHGVAPKGISTNDLKDAIRQTFGGSNCRHEYDCCGCASRHVDVRLTGRGRFMVHTQVSFNY